MKQGSVKNFRDNELQKVNGCSRYQTEKCTNQTILETKRYTIPSRNYPKTSLWFYLFFARETVNFLITDYSSIAADIFNFYNTTDYSQPKLSCMKQTFSSVFGSTTKKSTINACLLTARVKRGDEPESTLIERWEYDEGKQIFWRGFPGPVFNRVLNVSEGFKAIILRELRGFNSWESFSSLLISRAVIYRKDFENQIMTDSNTITVIPTYTLVIVIVFILATIVTSVIVHLTIAKDDRPKLNTIDGISSVTREEMEPTGRSMNEGSPVSIGLSKRNADEARFGTLRSEDVSTSYKDSKFIV